MQKASPAAPQREQVAIGRQNPNPSSGAQSGWRDVPHLEVFGAQRIAVLRAFQTQFRNSYRRQVAQGVTWRQKAAFHALRPKPLRIGQGQSLRHVEPAYRGPAQGIEVGTTSEGSPQVARQRPHIEPRGHTQFEPHEAALIGLTDEVVNRDHDRLEQDGFISPGQVVGFFTADAFRLVCGGSLLEGATEGCERLIDPARIGERAGEFIRNRPVPIIS